MRRIEDAAIRRLRPELAICPAEGGAVPPRPGPAGNLSRLAQGHGRRADRVQTPFRRGLPARLQGGPFLPFLFPVHSPGRRSEA